VPNQAEQDLVLVVDFGAQYAQLIARRVRQAQVYSEIIPSSMPVVEILAKKPKAIILSGGPSSVYEPGAPTLDPKLFEHNIPIFGICYGFQVMAAALGGVVTQTGKSEFGRTSMTHDGKSKLLGNLEREFKVWMSHGDSVTQPPHGFTSTAKTEATPIIAYENSDATLAGVQFHPEVMHSENGQEILRHWLINIVGCKPTWTSENIVATEVAKIKALVGDKRVICGLSGGVDSAVAAAIVQKAIGSQLTCVFVDHGLLREGEAVQVERDFVAVTGVELKIVDARAKFLSALTGVTDPETKRKIIGAEFIRSFESAAREISASGSVDYLVQGTLYPDVVESGGGEGTANIKSHHNVGGLPDDLQFTLIEPLRTLFKDEVREVGLQLGLPGEIVWRQPFPGPGLAI
jgi:GMP synthase (glutamine-hydrolysing)